jgi:nucleoid-associated protein YgaU
MTMGLFTFIKDAGSSLFKGGDEAQDIEKLLNEDLKGKIQDIKAGVSDGAVTLKGICDSVGTKEKAILLAGNVKGIEKVDGTDLESPPPAEAPESDAQAAETAEGEFYEIKSGDTLSKIAKQFYGNANKYPLIFEANREVIKDPDKIYPGQMIRIPKLGA